MPSSIGKVARSIMAISCGARSTVMVSTNGQMGRGILENGETIPSTVVGIMLVMMVVSFTGSGRTLSFMEWGGTLGRMGACSVGSTQKTRSMDLVFSHGVMESALRAIG